MRCHLRRTGLLGVLAGVVVVAGCGGGGGGGGGGSSSSGSSTVSLSDALIGPPPISSSLYANVATQQGYYKRMGLNMSFKYFGHGTDVAKSVLSGSQDVGTTATTAVIPLIAQGAPLKMLFGMNNVDWVVASTQPGVTTCKDLKGQNIGTDGTNNARELYLAALLKTCGLTIDDIHQVAIGAVPADIQKAAVAGQVKTDVLHVSEFAQVQALSKSKWTAIPAPPSLLKQFHYLVGFTTEKQLQSNHDAVVRFVASYILAAKWMADPANLDPFAQLASGAQKTALPVTKSGLKGLAKIPYWEPGLGLAKTNLMNMTDTLVSIGTFPQAKAPSYSDMVDPSIYKEAEKMAASGGPGS